MCDGEDRQVGDWSPWMEGEGKEASCAGEQFCCGSEDIFVLVSSLAIVSVS